MVVQVIQPPGWLAAPSATPGVNILWLQFPSTAPPASRLHHCLHPSPAPWHCHHQGSSTSPSSITSIPVSVPFGPEMEHVSG